MYQAPFKVASMGIYKGILRNRNGFVGIRISKKDLEELKLMEYNQDLQEPPPFKFSITVVIKSLAIKKASRTPGGSKDTLKKLLF